MLFTEEVFNMEELMEKLVPYNIEHKVKVAVVCFIFDSEGKLILNRRGPGARDEIGRLQALGGSVNQSDADFHSALKRELEEEAGSSSTIKIDYFIGAQLDEKFDNDLGEIVDWIILGYRGVLVSGELINSEPERSVGFERAFMQEFKKEELSTTAYNFIEILKSNEK